MDPMCSLPASQSQRRLRNHCARPLVQVYLKYNLDLGAAGITTPAEAERHYIAAGRLEGRVYKRLRIILRYTACTGLINQQYSHISAFSLAFALGAELVLPPAACRDSFAHYFRWDRRATAALFASGIEVQRIGEVASTAVRIRRRMKCNGRL